MRKAALIILSTLIILITFNYLYSRPKKIKKDVTQLIAENFQEFNFPQSNPGRVNIVVDVSQSMQGFSVAAPIFSGFLSAISGAISPLPSRWYSLSTALQSQPNFASFISPAIFKASASNFPKISDLLDDTSSLTIFITDLQFNNQTYYNGFSDLLTSNLSNEKYIYVSVSNLYFDGTIFPDMLRHRCASFNYSGNRPIFVISFGEKKYLDYNIKLLGNTGLSFDYHLPFIRNQILKFNIPKMNYGFINYTYKLPQKYDNVHLLKGNSTDSLRMKCTFDNKILDYWDIDKNAFKCEQCEVEGDSILKPVTGFDYRISEFLVHNGKVDMSIVTNRINPIPPKIIRVLIEINNSSLPNWVDDLNMNRGQPCNMYSNHILLLRELLSRPVQSISNPFVLASFYIEITK